MDREADIASRNGKPWEGPLITNPGPGDVDALARELQERGLLKAVMSGATGAKGRKLVHELEACRLLAAVQRAASSLRH